MSEMDCRRFLFFIVIIAHFAAILSICIASCADGYVSFYDRKPPFLASALHTTSHIINNTKIVNWYTSLAGIDAGYGFFAPNVSSGYILEFTSYDSSGYIINRERLPDFTHRESYIRYSSLLDTFQDKLTNTDKSDDRQSLKLRRLDAIIKSMAIKRLTNSHATDKIEAALYLYHFPSLKMYQRSHREPELLIVDQSTITTR